jgi:hypothetical protein
MMPHAFHDRLNAYLQGCGFICSDIGGEGTGLRRQRLHRWA